MPPEATDLEGTVRLTIQHAVGLHGEALNAPILLRSPPPFLFTTARTLLEPAAFSISSILRLPYVLWCWDRISGYALVLGNLAEGNVTRPFEPGDQELVEGALSVYIDVLRRKHNEVELRLAKAAAEEASAARARFVATLSHELRTPLNAIIGFSELLKAERALTPEQHTAYAAQILESGRSLLLLIDDILDYSQLARLTPQLSAGWYAAHDLLRKVVDELAGLAQQRGIAIAIEKLDRMPHVQVDPRRFHQILNNLLGNALKFTSGGGRISLRLETQEPGLTIAICDTGVGMRMEDIPRAMEPFRQLDGGLDRTFSGSGLGLPIARGLVEAHGGDLRIESALGQGTTVRIVLPAERVRWADAG